MSRAQLVPLRHQGDHTQLSRTPPWKEAGMKRGRVVRTAVRLLLAGFLLPFAMVISGPGVAMAATQYSAMKEVHYNEGNGYEQTLTCELDVGYRVSDSTGSTVVALLIKNWTCSVGGVLAWQVDAEDSLTSVSFNGSDTNTGADCDYFATGISLKTAKAGYSPGIRNGSTTSCAVNEACYMIDWHINVTGDSIVTWCEPLDLGPIPTLVSACPFGTINAAKLIKTGTDAAPGFNLKLDTLTTPSSATGNSWNVYVYTNTTIVDGVAGFQLSAGTTLAQLTNLVVNPNSSWAVVWNQGPIGIQFTQTSGPAQANNGTQGTNRANWDWTHIPQVTTSDDQKGMNFPPACQFWFGPKITPPGIGLDSIPLNTPGSTETEPTPSPNTPQPDSCSFVLWDPTTWLNGGMCAAVGLLGAVWGTLKSMLAAIVGLGATIAAAIADALAGIVGAVVDAISAMFVPSEGFFDAKWAEVSDGWSETAPAQWASAVTNFATPGEVEGCEGVPLEVTLPGDVQINEHLGGACDGTMATAANMVRIGLSFALVVGGGLACIRALGSGFGWNPFGGKGGDA